MATIPQEELRDALDVVLRRVSAGEEFTITAAGYPIARLSPHDDRRWVSGSALEGVFQAPPPRTLDVDLEQFPAQLVDAPLLRPATVGDAERVAAWHADPDVARFWDGETYTVAEIRERLARPDVEAWIVEDGGEPVGYLQAWREPDQPLRGGLDGFLVPVARGRGIMPAVASDLATRLLARGWSEVTVDPYAWNEQAVRAWGRAGFVEVDRHPPDEEHTAEWVLMRFEGGR